MNAIFQGIARALGFIVHGVIWGIDQVIFGVIGLAGRLIQAKRKV